MATSLEKQWKECKSCFDEWCSRMQLSENVLTDIENNYSTRIDTVIFNCRAICYQAEQVIKECGEQLLIPLKCEEKDQLEYVKSIEDKVKLIRELFSQENPNIYAKVEDLFNELRVLIKRTIGTLGNFSLKVKDGLKDKVTKVASEMYILKEGEMNQDENINPNIPIQPAVQSVEPSPPCRPFSFAENFLKRFETDTKETKLRKGIGFGFSYKERLVVCGDINKTHIYNMDSLEYVCSTSHYNLTDIKIIRNYDGYGNDGLLLVQSSDLTSQELELIDLKELVKVRKVLQDVQVKSVWKLHFKHVIGTCIKHGTPQNQNNSARGHLIFLTQKLETIEHFKHRIVIINMKGEIQKDFKHGAARRIAFLDDFMLVTDDVSHIISVFQEQNMPGQLDNWVFVSYYNRMNIVDGPITADPISKMVFIVERIGFKHNQVAVFKIEKGNLEFVKRLKLPEGSGTVTSTKGIESEHRITGLDFDIYTGKLWMYETAKKHTVHGNIVVLN